MRSLCQKQIKKYVTLLFRENTFYKLSWWQIDKIRESFSALKTDQDTWLFNKAASLF